MALVAAGLRSHLDLRNEKIGYKIREAQLMKVPYMLIIGAREANQQQVAVRQRSGEDLGSMSLDSFVTRVQQEIDSALRRHPGTTGAA